MACEPQVKFLAACWSSAAARDLKLIGDVSPHDLAVFERQVRSGEWQLWDVTYLGDRLGCLIWSVEHEGDAHSLIINAAAARSVSGVDLTKAMLAAFQSIATTSGARAIRCWTSRDGLRRKLENFGATSRYVMELTL